MRNAFEFINLYCQTTQSQVNNNELLYNFVYLRRCVQLSSFTDNPHCLDVVIDYSVWIDLMAMQELSEVIC